MVGADLLCNVTFGCELEVFRILIKSRTNNCFNWKPFLFRRLFI